MRGDRAAAFYGQLAGLVRAGVPMLRAVDLASQTAGGAFRRAAPALAARLHGGGDLAGGLAAAGFPPLEAALVQAGERSGRLPEICRELADLHAHEAGLWRALIGRLVYPAVLLHAVLVVPILPAVILGRLGPVWLLAGPAALWLLLALAYAWWRTALGSGLAARLALVRPWRFFTEPFLAGNTCLVMQSCLAAGMLPSEAVAEAAGACGNRHLAARLRDGASALRDGGLPDLACLLRSLGWASELAQIVEVGELGGTLDDALRRAAGLCRERFVERTTWAARITSGTIYAIAVLAVAATVIGMYASYLNQVKEIADGI